MTCPIVIISSVLAIIFIVVVVIFSFPAPKPVQVQPDEAVLTQEKQDPKTIEPVVQEAINE
jgi:hypothetical protein